MKVAVMGYGTVGSGVCEVIETHQDTLAKRTGGKALELARILDLREFPGDKHEALFTKDFNDILNDPEIQIVAETMGGVNPAFDFTMKLLASGRAWSPPTRSWWRKRDRSCWLVPKPTM